MAIEIEKKYLLTKQNFQILPKRLEAVSAKYIGEDFEINEIYGGGILAGQKAVLRLRTVDEKTILTFKKRFEGEAAIKKQIEYETAISDAQEMRQIIENLGFRKNLIYEKKRTTWKIDQTVIVLDELPFGYFMEIEGVEEEIERIEKLLEAETFTVEHRTYPHLTELLGKQQGETFCAKFPKNS